jgi:hypothetical protein
MDILHGLNLGGEHRLKLCENMVLRKVFALQRDAVTADWRR